MATIDITNENRVLNTRHSLQKCGVRSPKTFWRWRQKPDLGFPEPIQIGNRNYYYEHELDAFLKRLAEKRDAAKNERPEEAS